jgi:hypothetical protein
MTTVRQGRSERAKSGLAVLCEDLFEAPTAFDHIPDRSRANVIDYYQLLYFDGCKHTNDVLIYGYEEHYYFYPDQMSECAQYYAFEQ